MYQLEQVDVMIQYNMYEAKTDLSKITRLLEDKKEDCVVLPEMENQ